MKTFKRPTRLALALASVFAMGHAQADDGKSMLTFGGFGTVGVTHSSNEEGDYASSIFAPSGAGRSHDLDLGVDSRLGVQVNAAFTSQLSGVVQVVAAQRASNHFSPRVEWANLKYAITPELSVRVGRIALATYMVAESRLIGYANPWVRPPMETYNLSALTNSDGVDASYRRRFGSRQQHRAGMVWKDQGKLLQPERRHHRP